MVEILSCSALGALSTAWYLPVKLPPSLGLEAWRVGNEEQSRLPKLIVATSICFGGGVHGKHDLGPLPWVSGKRGHRSFRGLDQGRQEQEGACLTLP